MSNNKLSHIEPIRFLMVNKLVMSDNENPDLTDFTKEELLYFGKIATIGAKLNQIKLLFWRRAAIIFGTTIILSVIIDLLKMAEVI